jgi:hypothetical protein
LNRAFQGQDLNVRGYFARYKPDSSEYDNQADGHSPSRGGGVDGAVALIGNFEGVQCFEVFTVLSDVVDLLAERGVDIDRSTAPRWVQKFCPEPSQ